MAEPDPAMARAIAEESMLEETIRLAAQESFATGGADLVATIAKHVGRLYANLGVPKDTWRCFHCDEVFTDRRAALDHFGYDEIEKPACIQVLTETEKAIVEDRRDWRGRAFHAEDHNEQLHHELSDWRWTAREALKKAGGKPDGEVHSGELMMAIDQIIGRALAAEARLGLARRHVEGPWSPTHIHNGRGTGYVLVTEHGGLQVGDGRVLKDGDAMAIYWDQGGRWWVRHAEEFGDGRFVLASHKDGK